MATPENLRIVFMCKMTPIGVRLNLKIFHFDILCSYGVIKESLPGGRGGSSPPGEIGLTRFHTRFQTFSRNLYTTFHETNCKSFLSNIFVQFTDFRMIYTLLQNKRMWCGAPPSSSHQPPVTFEAVGQIMANCFKSYLGGGAHHILLFFKSVSNMCTFQDSNFFLSSTNDAKKNTSRWLIGERGKHQLPC